MRPSHALIAVVALGIPGHAFAHARLVSATPPVGSSIRAAPSEVAITYSEGVEPKFSSIEVQDSSGAREDTGGVRTAPGNNKQLVVGLKPLTGGTYKVIWHATSTDTHKTEGNFSFTVGP